MRTRPPAAARAGLRRRLADRSRLVARGTCREAQAALDAGDRPPDAPCRRHIRLRELQSIAPPRHDRSRRHGDIRRHGHALGHNEGRPRDILRGHGARRRGQVGARRRPHDAARHGHRLHSRTRQPRHSGHVARQQRHANAARHTRQLLNRPRCLRGSSAAADADAARLSSVSVDRCHNALGIRSCRIRGAQRIHAGRAVPQPLHERRLLVGRHGGGTRQNGLSGTPHPHHHGRGRQRGDSICLGSP